MTPEHLAKLENALRASADIPEATRLELLKLVAGLKAEVSASEPSAPPAHATSQVVEALNATVRDLEGTHPHVVELVNQIALTLSHGGI